MSDNFFEGLIEIYGKKAKICDSDGEHEIMVMLIPYKMTQTSEAKFSFTEMGVKTQDKRLCVFSGDFDFKGCDDSTLIYDGETFDFINDAVFDVFGFSSHRECLVAKREELYSV